jgi:spermidine synthase
MYHVTGIGLTAIIIYCISYFYYRTGFFSQQTHRKFWNIILAGTFLITAMAGIFMALQITYKWNIPFIKSVLKWHVEFGAGMAFTGIFHFLFHLSYFTKIFGKQMRVPINQDIQILTSDEISTNLFLVGFTSSTVQLLLIREILNISGGYELIVGTFLGSWLIISAFGSYFAGRSPLNDIRKISLIFSAAPIISLLLLFTFSRLFFEPGQTSSFLTGMIFTFLSLIPFCIVSGFVIIKLINCAKEVNGYVPGKSFSVETIGGVIAGLLISVLTSGILNTYQILLTIIILYLVYVLLTFYIKTKLPKFLLKIMAVLAVTFIIIGNPDILFRQILLPGIKVTGSSDTPYGNITKGEYAGEENLYYNQRLLSYQDDVTEREEDIHYAMLQRINPQKILILSGSLKAHLPEILKYPVKEITYIERDPYLIKEEKVFDNEKNCYNLLVANTDAYRFIKNAKEKFDVVICLLPPPSTLQLNRFFTFEFFREVNEKLNPGGVFICSPGPGNEYFNKESIDLYSSIFNSLTGSFKYVRPVNGNKLYFISSDTELSLSFCKLAEDRKIKTVYVNSDFLDEDIIKRKSDQVLALMDPKVNKNSSLYPIACYHFQSYSFSKYLEEKTPAIVIIILAFAVPSFMIKRKNLIMYFSASALAGFEIIALLTIQLTVGSMYQLTALVIAVLMGGLAAGSGMNLNVTNRFNIRFIAILLMIFYFIMAFVFTYIPLLKKEFFGIALIFLSTLIPAFLTGHIFRRLTLNNESEISISNTYSADLSGSAPGFILMSGFAVPALGIKVSVIILSLLIFAGFLFGSVRSKE